MVRRGRGGCDGGGRRLSLGAGAESWLRLDDGMAGVGWGRCCSLLSVDVDDSDSKMLVNQAHVESLRELMAISTLTMTIMGK
jgi:hypothetical protein